MEDETLCEKYLINCVRVTALLQPFKEECGLYDEDWPSTLSIRRLSLFLEGVGLEVDDVDFSLADLTFSYPPLSGGD